jgi:hypothetical protein
MGEVIRFRTFLCQLNNHATWHIFAFKARSEGFLFCAISELALHTRGRHVSRNAFFAPNLLLRKAILLQITDKLLVVVLECTIYQTCTAVNAAYVH